MTIEASQYINELNSSFPRSTDLLKEGDDHIRMIKANLKNTFPNFTGSTKVSSDWLNNASTNIAVSSSGITMNKGVTMGPNTGIDVSNNRLMNLASAQADGDAVSLGYLKSYFTNILYPVGSVYWTMDINVDPNTMFSGTTWVRMEGGRYLMVAGSSAGSSWQTSGGQMGGSNSFTLNNNHLPRHAHIIPEHGHGAWADNAGNHNHGGAYSAGVEISLRGGGSDALWNSRYGWPGELIGYAGEHSHGIHVNNQPAFWTNETGDGWAVEYMPSFINVYAWRRSA